MLRIGLEGCIREKRISLIASHRTVLYIVYEAVPIRKTRIIFSMNAYAVIQELDIRKKLQARYVRMVAKNPGLCPDWHVGAGEKSWIFCDEVVIE